MCFFGSFNKEDLCPFQNGDFFLFRSVNVGEEERKLVKICAFHVPDSTNVNVTNTSTRNHLSFCVTKIFEMPTIHNTLH